MKLAFVDNVMNMVQFIEERDAVPSNLPDWAIAVEVQPDEPCELMWKYTPDATPRFVEIPKHTPFDVP